MSALLSALLFVLLCSAFCVPRSAFSQTNVIYGYVGDYSTNAQRRVNVTVTLLDPSLRTTGEWDVRRDSISTTTGTNGYYAFTNLLWGQYRRDIAGVSGTKFIFYVGTNTLGTVPITSLTTNANALPPDPGTNYYTQAQTDALFDGAPFVRGVAQGTNGIATTTNNGVVTVHFTGSGSGTTLTNNSGTVGVLATNGTGVALGTNTSHLLSTPVLVGMFSYNNKGIYPAWSGDGIRWDLAQGWAMDDPDAAYDWGGCSWIRRGPFDYLMVNSWATNVDAGTQNRFSVWHSTNLMYWTFRTNYLVTIPSINVSNVWAPELFQDGATVYNFPTIGTNASYSGMQIYVTVAQNTNLTEWSTPTLVTNLGANVIDAMMVKEGATYYLFFKNETTKYVELATSSNPTNGFTVVGSGNWAGWGAEVEGQTLSKRPDGRWVMLLDNYTQTLKYNYSFSTNLLTGWTAKTQCIVPELNIGHGTMVSIPMAEAAALIQDANSGTNTFEEFFHLTVKGSHDGAGQLKIRNNGANNNVGMAFYPTNTGSGWSFGGDMGQWGIYGPFNWYAWNFAVSGKVLTIYSNLTAQMNVTAGASGVGRFIGNASGTTNTPMRAENGIDLTTPGGTNVISGATLSNSFNASLAGKVDETDGVSTNLFAFGMRVQDNGSYVIAFTNQSGDTVDFDFPLEEWNFVSSASVNAFTFDKNVYAPSFGGGDATFTGNAAGLTNLPATSLTGTIQTNNLAGAVIHISTFVGPATNNGQFRVESTTNATQGVVFSVTSSGNLFSVQRTNLSGVLTSKTKIGQNLGVFDRVDTDVVIFTRADEWPIFGGNSSAMTFPPIIGLGAPAAVNSLQARDVSLTRTSAGNATFGTNFTAIGFIAATNGYQILQAAFILTNAVPASTASTTNWALQNIGGIPTLVATNTAGGGGWLTKALYP
jgi:hypothetical protein